MIKFEVLGQPQGKERPRFCRLGNKTITYTPQKTNDYENRVKQSYLSVSNNTFKKGTPLEILILAFYEIPKSTNKSNKQKMIYKDILPTKKPDSDNIIKIICDALNGIAYEDDCQICRVLFDKSYSFIPKVVVEISQLNKTENETNYSLLCRSEV